MVDSLVPRSRSQHRLTVFALYQRSWLDRAAGFFDKSENSPVPKGGGGGGEGGGDCSSDLPLSSSLSGNAEGLAEVAPAGMHREAEENVDQELLLSIIEAQLVQDTLAIAALGYCQCTWVDLFDKTRHFAIESIAPFQVERGGLLKAWEAEDSDGWE